MALVINTRMVAGAVGLAALMASAPAMAGRCGHSYPVDAPTTLSKVARACNVSLSALREANTGVDPNYVSPGEHLAIPDEIASASDVPSGGADLGVASGGYSSPIYHYAEYTEPPRTPSAKTNGQYGSATSPYFVQASATAPLAFNENMTLSYQKRSAARIRHAGVQATPVLLSPMRSYTPNSVMISTQSDLVTGEPISPLMECAVLRRQPNGKIAQVREFKPVPQGRDTPPHCAVITNTSSNAAPLKLSQNGIGADSFLLSEFEGKTPAPIQTVLKGYISGADAECVTLHGDDGMVWRISVPLAPMDLLGKEATIWAELTSAPKCGGLVMNRAVYAEQAN